MRGLFLQDGNLELREDYPAPTAMEGWSRIRVLQAGICETDLQLVAGYMGFSGILGHEFVGIAESGPLLGRRVVGEINCICGQCDMCGRELGNHCRRRSVIGIVDQDGAFADELLGPDANLHVVPDQVSDDLATLIEPIAAALQILEQVQITVGMQAVVVGDGRLGNLCAQVLDAAGCRVLVVGKHSSKLEYLHELGLATCRQNDAPRDRSADLAVDCTGSPTGLESCFSMVRPRGTVVMKTTLADPHHLSLAPVVIDELNVIGSRCGPFDAAIATLRKDQLNLDRFISASYNLEDYRSAFEQAISGDALKVILKISNRA